MPLALELTENMYLAYNATLAFSGVLLAWLAISGFGNASTGSRVLNGLFAVGFLGYAGYLFFANPDSVTILFYAFAVPVIMLFRAFQSWQASKKSVEA
jgi:hypothetical protein